MNYVGQYYDQRHGFAGPFFGLSRVFVFDQIIEAMSAQYDVTGLAEGFTGDAHLTTHSVVWGTEAVHWSISEIQEDKIAVAYIEMKRHKGSEAMKKWRAKQTPAQLEEMRKKAIRKKNARLAAMTPKERAAFIEASREYARAATAKYRASNAA